MNHKSIYKYYGQKKSQAVKHFPWKLHNWNVKCFHSIIFPQVLTIFQLWLILISTFSDTVLYQFMTVYWAVSWPLLPVRGGWGLLTHWNQDKMAAIFQTTFSNSFSWMKIFKFQLKFHWNLFLRVQLKYSSIGSDEGLALTRRQAIIWNNDG